MKNLLQLLCFVSFISCHSYKRIKLKFLGDYIISDSLVFKNTKIGGISGIDFYQGKYYMVLDDAKNPRYLTSKISIKNDTISSIKFLDMIQVGDIINKSFKDNWLDLESIFVEQSGNIHIVGEGSINKGKDPFIFSINQMENSVKSYSIPNYFKANSLQKPKHNATLESSTQSFDTKGFWVGMEGVLPSDGVEPTFVETQSPIRITYYDYQTQKPITQFAYLLSKIERQAKGNVNLNGVTAILEYEKNRFFVVERTYQSGFGTFGNVIKIYDVSIDDNTTNTLPILSLKKGKFIPAKKRLLLNFNQVKDKLSKGIIDNIEGITFGPKLSNGNQTLILVSDDNFQKYGKQLNQFLLLEIIKK